MYTAELFFSSSGAIKINITESQAKMDSIFSPAVHKRLHSAGQVGGQVAGQAAGQPDDPSGGLQPTVLYAPEALFTGPQGRLVSHNWFKLQDKLLADLRETIFASISQLRGCILCNENYDELVDGMERTLLAAGGEIL